MKVIKRMAVLTMSAVLAVGTTSTAFAGTWKTGVGENQSKWWYDNENGSYANTGWNWIDGNNDGIAECYYFDNDGWLLVNTSTPDGYFVNENGAWVNNGAIETKTVTLQNSGGETQGTTDYVGWYNSLEEEDGYSDFSWIKIIEYNENSITISEFQDNTRVYNKGADNKYYPVDGDAYFKYVDFDGNTLVCCYEGTSQDWIQHFVKGYYPY